MKKYTYLLLLLFATINLAAQVGINGDNSDPDASAMLDVKSTNKGMLVPRMTSSQRTIISNAAIGLLVFDTDTESFWFKDSSGWTELVSGGTSTIADADADTKIQVEESADEDKIRFDLAGSQVLLLDRTTSGKSRMIFSSSDSGIYIGNGVAEHTTGIRNVAIGHNAFKTNTTGSFNSAFGIEALAGNDLGRFNVAVGLAALFSNSAGNNNIGIGVGAGSANVSGGNNVFIGYDAGSTSTDLVPHSKDNNVMIGHEAGSTNLGNANVFLGYQAGKNAAGSNKLFIENSDSDFPLLYGEFDTDLVRINGKLNINNAFSFPTVDGTATQVLQTDGNGNLSWTAPSAGVLIQDTDTDTKIQVEESADEDIIRFDVGGIQAWTMDSRNLIPFNSGQGIFIGENAGANDSLQILVEQGVENTSNILLGYKSGEQNGIGAHNIGIGAETMGLSDSSNFNLAIGSFALKNIRQSNSNIGIGPFALNQLQNGDENLSIGNSALSSLDVGEYNVAIGTKAMDIAYTGNRNVAIGHHVMGENILTERNVAIGYRAGYGDDNSKSTENNVWIGYQAGQYSEGVGNVFLGSSVGAQYSWRNYNNRLAIDNSNTNTPLLYGEFDNDLLRINGTLNINNAFSLPTTDGSANQVLQTDGSGSLSWVTLTGNDQQDLTLANDILSITNGTNNIDLSAYANDNTALIQDADTNTKIQVEESADEDIIRFDLGGTEYMRLNRGRLEIENTGFSIFLGNEAGLNDDFTNNYNIGIGEGALKNNTEGAVNLAIGRDALRSNTIGNANMAMGFNALGSIEASNNIAFGNGAMETNRNGTGNISIGHRAGAQVLGSSNIYIGHEAGFGKNPLLNQIYSQNVMLGYQAGRNHEGNGNVFLGYQAGFNESGNNKLYIENSNAATPLIYGEFDNDLVRINGDLEVTGTFPGSDDQKIDVLTLNGNNLEISLENDGETTKTVDLSNLAVPVGSIMIWATATPPTGWLLCNGQDITGTPLATVLGSDKTPNLQNRFPFGAGSLFNLGDPGGRQAVTLMEANIPEHNHDAGTLKTAYSYKSSNSGAGDESKKDGSDDQFYDGNAITGDTGNWGGLNGSTKAFDILPPFLALNFIIKAE